MKQFVDRPHTSNIKHFERVSAELSPYLTEIEMDKVVDFMCAIEDSKYDINPSPSDSITQMRIILGSDRYQEVREQWGQHNQKLLTSFGRLKYKEKATGNLYDGLDDYDDATLFDKVYV